MSYALVFVLMYVAGTSAAVLPVHPKVDAICLGSPMHLGTDNIPMNDNPKTSVINMWAFVGRDPHMAIAWHYENRLGKHYVQLSIPYASVSKEALSRAQYQRFMVVEPHSELASENVQVTPSGLAALRHSYARVGIRERACFTNRLSESHFSGARR
jgi:hypothetical protein